MTALPIDFRRAPYKDKYIDEETPMFARWFIFGKYEDGTVGICSGDDDIFVSVPRDVAERIVAARHAFCDAIIDEIGIGAFRKKDRPPRDSNHLAKQVVDLATSEKESQ